MIDDDSLGSDHCSSLRDHWIYPHFADLGPSIKDLDLESHMGLEISDIKSIETTFESFGGSGLCRGSAACW